MINCIVLVFTNQLSSLQLGPMQSFMHSSVNVMSAIEY